MKLLTVFLTLSLLMAAPVLAQSKDTENVLAAPVTACASATDIPCMLNLLDNTTTGIDDANWRDQTVRELAKLMAKQERYDDALALIKRIDNPDTRAMTIRGIGMAAASLKKPPESYKELFEKLTVEAEIISHPPSHAIALTYIAMAQAFAGDDEGATATAKTMDNPALRNKALAESAEIQAERENLDAALASIGHIDDLPFRDKAHRTISKILANSLQYDKALAAAAKIDNNYQRAQAILYILARQISPEEVSVE
ncbi:MAG: hypothetical protein KKA05_04975 [Alphaproteobacteria bacterium]|nr:hypothetical protein [Alphaproteobacteria bacterium]